MQGFQAAIAILEVVIPLFVHNQVLDAEIDAFLADFGQILSNPSQPVTFPPITVGSGTVTLTYAPKA